MSLSIYTSHRVPVLPLGIEEKVNIQSSRATGSIGASTVEHQDLYFGKKGHPVASAKPIQRPRIDSARPAEHGRALQDRGSARRIHTIQQKPVLGCVHPDTDIKLAQSLKAIINEERRLNEVRHLVLGQIRTDNPFQGMAPHQVVQKLLNAGFTPLGERKRNYYLHQDLQMAVFIYDAPSPQEKHGNVRGSHIVLWTYPNDFNRHMARTRGIRSTELKAFCHPEFKIRLPIAGGSYDARSLGLPESFNYPASPEA